MTWLDKSVILTQLMTVPEREMDRQS